MSGATTTKATKGKATTTPKADPKAKAPAAASKAAKALASAARAHLRRIGGFPELIGDLDPKGAGAFAAGLDVAMEKALGKAGLETTA